MRPPRLAEWLLGVLRRSPDARYLAGDLAEGFAKRAAADPKGARRWYWAQVARSGAHRPDLQQRDRASRLAMLSGDVLAALKTVYRRPVPTAVSALVVMLGVTATSTLAAVTYSVLYRPLSFPEPERLIRLWETRGGNATPSHMYLSSSLDQWRDEATTVDAIGAYVEGDAVTILGPDGAERVTAAHVALDLLSMLGAVPVEGRLLDAGDESAIVISERLASRHFADGRAVGRPLALDARPYTVVGVLPDDFTFPSAETQIWVPETWRRYAGPEGNGRFDVSRLQVVARLAPGVPAGRAAAEATQSAQRAPVLDPVVENGLFGAISAPRIIAMPLQTYETREVRSALMVLLAGVTLLMLTAIASVAGMQLARSTGRRREFAVRAAIGAGRRRLAIQLLAEAFWIAALGGAAAVLATRWLLQAAPRLLPADFPRLDVVGFDGVALAAIVIATIAGSLLIGLLPAIHTGRMPLAPTIADDNLAPVGLGSRSRSGRARSLMIGGQMAVAVVLLVAAGLTGKTLLRLVGEDLGYEPERVLMARLIGVGEDQSARVSAGTLHQLVERLQALPDVTGVAVATALPFQQGSGRMGLGLRLPGPDGSQVPVSVSENSVTPAYFDLMGMRLIEGRLLTDEDYDGDGASFVVNETFARRYLGERPLGAFPNGGRVIGVVADVKDRGAAGPVDAQMFTLYREDQTLLLRPSTIYLRTHGNATSTAPLAREVVRQVDDRLGLDEVSTIEAHLSAQVARPRLYAWVVTFFAVFAVVIATVGLFGVLSYAVSRRTREIGVRTALGASPGQVARAVLAQGMLIAGAGTLVGLGAAWALAGFLSSLLYQVTPYDPFVFTAVPAGLLLVAALACYLPARRAARIDPLAALRSN